LNRGLRVGSLLAGSVLLPLAAGAQSLDISQPPALKSPTPLTFPRVQRARLPNGLRLYVVEQHEVPLVQLTLAIRGGGREDGDNAGLATFTARMLQEGADTFDAFGIAAQAEYLGARLSTEADWDRSYVQIKVPRRTLAPAIRLLSLVTLKPTFRGTDLQRQRDLRFAGIRQSGDEPDSVATNAFNAVLYPAGHPYHQPLGGDSAATSRLDSALVRRFWQRVYRPNRAALIITGDITLPTARRLIAQAFGSWRPGADPGTGSSPGAVSPPAHTTVYLVDKPGAAQSVVVLGQPGVERKNPDFYALLVMNTILGGSFSSRLNQNLRETKGYTYGAFSGFSYRPLPGPFRARAAVRTDVTDSSLVEFFREIKAMRDSPVTDVELRRAKAYIALGLPRRLETAEQLGDAVENLLLFGLPLDYYEGYLKHIMAISSEEVQRVARKYLAPEQTSIVVVGDLKKIRPGIAALGLGPLQERGAWGQPKSVP
jgi:zinc protease